VEDIERTLKQENVGRDNMAGSGEWPDPDTPPSDVAAGTDPIRREIIERQREATVEEGGTSTQAGMQQDGRSAGTPGPARNVEIPEGNASEIAPPEGIKETLNRDRVAGGSSSIPAEMVPDDEPGR
jgi:hypothetical protein